MSGSSLTNTDPEYCQSNQTPWKDIQIPKGSYFEPKDDYQEPDKWVLQARLPVDHEFTKSLSSFTDACTSSSVKVDDVQSAFRAVQVKYDHLIKLASELHSIMGGYDPIDSDGTVKGPSMTALKSDIDVLIESIATDEFGTNLETVGKTSRSIEKRYSELNGLVERGRHTLWLQRQRKKVQIVDSTVPSEQQTASGDDEQATSVKKEDTHDDTLYDNFHIGDTEQEVGGS